MRIAVDIGEARRCVTILPACRGGAHSAAKVMVAFDAVPIAAAVAWVLALPEQARAVFVLLLEFAGHWWFWVLVLALYLFGLIPFTQAFAVRRMFQALDRSQRRMLGLCRRPSWAAAVWLVLLTAFAGRFFGWWGL